MYCCHIWYKAHVSVAQLVSQHGKVINAEESVQGPSDRCIPREQIRSLEIYKLVARNGGGRPRLSKNSKYRGADKSLALPGRKQVRKHVRDARDFNNIETRAVIKFFFLQGKAPKEIYAVLTETLACFLPG